MDNTKLILRTVSNVRTGKDEYRVAIDGMTNVTHLDGRLPNGEVARANTREEAMLLLVEFRDYWISRVRRANAGPSLEYVEKYGTANE